MPKPKLTKVERNALVWVNKIRRAEGRKALERLPKGDILDEFQCPIARALNHGRVAVTPDCIHVSPRATKKIAAFRKVHLRRAAMPVIGRVAFRTPPSLLRFISWFDGQWDEAAEELVRHY